MLCENCRENEVNFKYTEIINGKKREISLCDKCAKKLGLKSSDFDNDFENLFELELAKNFLPSIGKTSIGNMIKDDYFESFNNIGVLNKLFSNLYQQNEKINCNKGLSEQEKQDVLNDISKATNKANKVNKKQQLQNELEKAIKEERYEDAAKLRDEIKKIN